MCADERWRCLRTGPSPTAFGVLYVTADRSNVKRKQVPRACLNCRKAHSGCNCYRPCERCIKRRIEHTCVDSRNARTRASPARDAGSSPLPSRGITKRRRRYQQRIAAQHGMDSLGHAARVPEPASDGGVLDVDATAEPRSPPAAVRSQDTSRDDPLDNSADAVSALAADSIPFDSSDARVVASGPPWMAQADLISPSLEWPFADCGSVCSAPLLLPELCDVSRPALM